MMGNGMMDNSGRGLRFIRAGSTSNSREQRTPALGDPSSTAAWIGVCTPSRTGREEVRRERVGERNQDRKEKESRCR